MRAILACSLIPSTSAAPLLIRRSVSYLSRKKNYYDILGVKTDASNEDIKKAFVQKTNELHPDSNTGSTDDRIGWSRMNNTEKFMEVKEAYDCLRHPGKRRIYDDDRLLRSGAGFLKQVNTSKFEEPTIISLNKKRNDTYMGPGKTRESSNHFRNPEEEYYREKYKNRKLTLLGVAVVVLVLCNIGYVRYLHQRDRSDRPVIQG